MGVEKYFVGVILVLVTILTVVVAFGFYASMTADRVVGAGFPVSRVGEGGGGGGTSPTSGVSTFTTLVLDTSDISGNVFCINQGYATCVTGGIFTTAYYEQSTDLSCSTTQSEDHIWTIVDCSETLTLQNTTCSRILSPAFAEPFYGDYSE